MDSNHKTEEACINLANSLIVQCQAPVPRIQFVSQLGSITFIHLFQCLCNKPLTGIIDYPQSVKDELHNMDLLISSLSTEVLNLSLSHLNSADIVEGDPVAVHNLLEIFMGYYEFVLKTNVNSSVSNVLSKPDSQFLNQENYICSLQLQETGTCEGQSEGSTVDLIQECKDAVFENSDCSTSELIRESEEIAAKLGINVGKINNKNELSNCVNVDEGNLRAGVDDYKFPSSVLEESLSDSEDYYFMESDENEQQIETHKSWRKSRSSNNGKTTKRKVYQKMTSASSNSSIEDSLSQNTKVSSNYKTTFKTLEFEENDDLPEFYDESSDFISRSKNGDVSKEPGGSTSDGSGKNLTSTINGKCDCLCHRNTLIERIHIIKRKQLQKKGYPNNSKSCLCCMNKKLEQRSSRSRSTNSKLKHKILSSLNEDSHLDERRICNYNTDLAMDDKLTKEKRVIASYKSRYSNCYKPYQSLRNRLVQCANTYGFYIPIKQTPKDMLELVNTSRFLEERENIARLTVFDELVAYLKKEVPIAQVIPNMKKEIITKYQRELQALVKLYLAKEEAKPSSIKDYNSKLLALKNIISKQYKAAERKNEVQKRLQKCQSVQNQIRNHRILTAKFKRSFDSSHIEIQSQIKKERAKEEQMLQELFGKGLATKKQKLKELQKCTKEMKGLMSSQYKEELKTLENFYLTQIEMLAEGLVSEQMELKAKEKAQLKILEQLKEEFEQKLQKLQKAEKLKDQQVHSCCGNEKNLKTYV